jgi:hypothetical protein
LPHPIVEISASQVQKQAATEMGKFSVSLTSKLTYPLAHPLPQPLLHPATAYIRQSVVNPDDILSWRIAHSLIAFGAPALASLSVPRLEPMKWVS